MLNELLGGMPHKLNRRECDIQAGVLLRKVHGLKHSKHCSGSAPNLDCRFDVDSAAHVHYIRGFVASSSLSPRKEVAIVKNRAVSRFIVTQHQALANIVPILLAAYGSQSGAIAEPGGRRRDAADKGYAQLAFRS